MASGTSATGQSAEPYDDYAVDREVRPPAKPAADHLLRVLTGLLLLIVAAVSLGVCWVVGLLLHLF